MDAFDADVLIYAGVVGHPLGRRVRDLFRVEPRSIVGLGSVLLLPEVLSKPMRDGRVDELTVLVGFLSRLELRAVDPVIAEVATSLSAAHRLKAVDAVHLATAVIAGADRFVTNDRKDFPTTISEIDITYPDALDDP